MKTDQPLWLDGDGERVDICRIVLNAVHETLEVGGIPDEYGMAGHGNVMVAETHGLGRDLRRSRPKREQRKIGTRQCHEELPPRAILNP